MAPNKYLICKDKEDARKMLENKGVDPRILLGEKQTHHIHVVGFAKTKDGDFIVEVPGTLKTVQDSISLSANAGKLKTKEETWALMPAPELG
jgi:hypothetical protein